MTKNELRQHIRAQETSSCVLRDMPPAPGSTIMAYWPLKDEVDTRPFIGQCAEQGVHVVLPVVEGDDLKLRLYRSEESMSTGMYNIQEPQGDNYTHLEQISRIYVPGIAFTRDGRRLGRGKGYYDRFLARLQAHFSEHNLPMPELVGVCAPERLLQDIPTESHDMRVHWVKQGVLCCLMAVILLGSCQQNNRPADNPAFAQVMDTTGADDPYIYEGDSTVHEREHIRREQHNWRLRHEVHRTVRAPYINKERGIISEHDHLFKSAAAQTGWDWRLIAAQCYQESGFDPMARSGAGARGLMQIMPSTAQHLGLSMADIHRPGPNVNAAAKYIRELSGLFRDIRDHEERIHFVLAAYNGGYNHIRDAMALASKYGASPQHWRDVSRFVLGLQQPRYYRDPVVRHGYMIGSETANYVTSIIQRARQYGAQLQMVALPAGWKAFALSDADQEADEAPTASRPSRPANRFTRGNSAVLRPEELQNQP